MYTSAATVWTHDVLPLHQEAPAYHGGLALVALEAGAVPVAILEGDELGATNTSDWLGTLAATFSKQLAVAVSTVRQVVHGGELLPSQRLVTVCTREALTVPGAVLVADAAFVDHPSTLGTLLGIVTLVARHTHHTLLPGHERLVAYREAALTAREAIVVPILTFVLELLHSSTERIAAAVTASGEVVVMADRAVDLVVLGGKRLVHQGAAAAATFEAELVPVPLLVG